MPPCLIIFWGFDLIRHPGPTQVHNELMELRGNIRAYCRVRPMNKVRWRPVRERRPCPSNLKRPPPLLPVIVSKVEIESGEGTDVTRFPVDSGGPRALFSEELREGPSSPLDCSLTPLLINQKSSFAGTRRPSIALNSTASLVPLRHSRSSHLLAFKRCSNRHHYHTPARNAE